MHVHTRLQMLMQMRLHLVIHRACAAVLRTVLHLLLRAPSSVRDWAHQELQVLAVSKVLSSVLPEAIMVGSLDGGGCVR